MTKKTKEKDSQDHHFLATRYLSDADFQAVRKFNPTSLNDDQIKEVIWFINLCDVIATHYEEEGYCFEAAVKGLRYGLALYLKNDHKSKDKYKLATYLTWYMKTAVEKDLGRDNEDTKKMSDEMLS